MMRNVYGFGSYPRFKQSLTHESLSNDRRCLPGITLGDRLRRWTLYIFCSDWAAIAQVGCLFSVQVLCLISFSCIVIPEYLTYVFTECQNSNWKKSDVFLKNAKSYLNIRIFSSFSFSFNISVPPILEYTFLLSNFEYIRHEGLSSGFLCDRLIFFSLFKFAGPQKSKTLPISPPWFNPSVPTISEYLHFIWFWWNLACRFIYSGFFCSINIFFPKF